MSTKSNVTYLADFCNQKKFNLPVYEFSGALENLSFDCTVEVMGIKAYGNGRAKRLAKNDAAKKMMQHFCNQPNYDIDKELSEKFALSTSLKSSEIEINEVLPPVDMVMMLRNYCVQNRCPLPKFEVPPVTNMNSGYTAVCRLLSMRRHASGLTKKEAKQNVAAMMLKAISNDDIGTTIEKIKKERFAERHDRFKYFNCYSDLLKNDTVENPGIKLADRHNYFANFKEELKEAAFAVLNGSYECVKTKAMDVFKALDLTPIVSDDEILQPPMIMITVDCELDVLFLGEESEIYNQIIDYFQIMLKSA